MKAGRSEIRWRSVAKWSGLAALLAIWLWLFVLQSEGRPAYGQTGTPPSALADVEKPAGADDRAVAGSGPAWLGFVNGHRSAAGLPRLDENVARGSGCRSHARYIVETGDFAHGEDERSSWYSAAGHECGKASNIIASASPLTDEEAITGIMHGPFHAIAVIDPQLRETAYGAYQNSAGVFTSAAVLDVSRGRGSVPESVSFPIMWTKQGATATILSYAVIENPDPLTNCSGYRTPTGRPSSCKSEMAASLRPSRHPPSRSMEMHCLIASTPRLTT